MKNILFVLLCGHTLLFEQTAKQISIKADSLYKAKSYHETACIGRVI